MDLEFAKEELTRFLNEELELSFEYDYEHDRDEDEGHLRATAAFSCRKRGYFAPKIYPVISAVLS